MLGFPQHMSERQKMLWFQFVFSIQKAHAGVTVYLYIYTHTQSLKYIILCYLCMYIYIHKKNNILVIPSPIQPALKHQEKCIRIVNVYTTMLSI